MKPLAIDLFCGLGGWAEGFLAEGYDVIGVDNDPRFAEGYEALGGHFILADVRDLDGRDFRAARCIVASPPCQGFSTANFHTRKPEYIPDSTLWEAACRIGREASAPCIIENVRGAMRWFGPLAARHGPFCLWGDVSTLIPTRKGGKGWTHRRNPHRPTEVAKIPLPLARAVARGFL